MNPIVEAYLACALWLATDEDGRPLDEKYSTSAFTQAAQKEARNAVVKFFADVKESIGELDKVFEKWDLEQIGHDLWLTRNGHGAGFWDRGLPHGEALSECAKRLGEANVYECGNNRHISIE